MSQEHHGKGVIGDKVMVESLISMDPYYNHLGITIYHGDCVEILPNIGSFDLLLTDPPYGIFSPKKRPFDLKHQPHEWDIVPTVEVFKMMFEICDKHIVWGFNYFADKLGPCNGLMVWDKKTGRNRFADGEVAWSDVVGTMRIFRHQWCGAFKDSERGECLKHPTQKPIELMTWCIGHAKNPKTILDPFMGSGTTLRAAKDLSISAVGIEKEEKYCEIAAKRLSQEVFLF